MDSGIFLINIYNVCQIRFDIGRVLVISPLCILEVFVILCAFTSDSKRSHFTYIVMI